MNGLPAQEGSEIIRLGGSKVASFLAPVLTLFLGILVGLGSAYFLIPQRLSFPPAATPAPSPKIIEEDLPIGLEVLQNPAVYEWRGSVEGKLVSKDAHSFTLDDGKGNRITITDIMPLGATFKTLFMDVTSPEEPKEVTLGDIPIGTTLRGEFWIFKGGRNTPVGGTFVIVK